MREQRKFVRIPEDSQISYEILHDKKTGEFITRDISQGGIRFFAHEFIPQNTLLKIKLTLQTPQKMSFNFEAVVRVAWIERETRHKRYEIGAEFIDMPKKIRGSLADYIKSVLEKE